MDKILIYPVDRECASVLQSTDWLPDAQITALVSPPSWGFVGEEYDCGDRRLTVSGDFSESLAHCNIVWLVDSWNKLDFETHILPVVAIAVEHGRKVVCFRQVSEDQKIQLRTLGVICVGYENPLLSPPENNRAREIRTPTVFVMSTTENCNKFYVQAGLWGEFSKLGYKVLWISSRKEAQAFGGHTIPKFMLDNRLSENEKILFFNYHLRELEKEERPEIILIGIPGAVTNYNSAYSRDYGLLALEISEAVDSDFAILSSPFATYDPDYFTKIDTFLSGRLGIHIDLHNLAPCMLDVAEAETAKKMVFLTPDEPLVQQKTNTLRCSDVLSLNNKSGIHSAVERIIEKLSANTDAVII